MRINPNKFFPIPGYEGIYEINCLSDIRRISSGKILKQSSCADYKTVKLSKNGIAKLFRVHALMGLTFLRPLKKGEGYFHKNHDKYDNILSNIYIDTISNVYKKISKKGTRAKEIEQFDENGNLINRFRSCREASKVLFLSLPQIQARCNLKMVRCVPPYLRWVGTKCKPWDPETYKRRLKT